LPLLLLMLLRGRLVALLPPLEVRQKAVRVTWLVLLTTI
jgi:hypothetical protein